MIFNSHIGSNCDGAYFYHTRTNLGVLVTRKIALHCGRNTCVRIGWEVKLLVWLRRVLCLNKIMPYFRELRRQSKPLAPASGSLLDAHGRDSFLCSFAWIIQVKGSSYARFMKTVCLVINWIMVMNEILQWYNRNHTYLAGVDRRREGNAVFQLLGLHVT